MQKSAWKIRQMVRLEQLIYLTHILNIQMM